MADEWAVQSVEAEDPWSVASVQPMKPKRRRSLVEDATGFMANVNANIPLFDEAVAAGGTVVNALAGRAPLSAGSYRNELSRQRGFESDYQAEHPSLASLAAGTGLAAGAAVPVGGSANAFAQAPRAVNALRGAGAAALTGGVYGATDRGSFGERTGAAFKEATNPLNLALGAVGGSLATRGKPKPAKAAPAPSLEQLQGQRDAAYKAVEQSGHRFSNEEMVGLLSDMRSELGKVRFDPDFHPRAGRMMEKLAQRVDEGVTPTLAELDDLRKFIGENVSSVSDRTERMMGRKMTGAIDRFIESVDGGAELVNARRLHGKVRKTETVQAGLARAERQAGKSGSGGNIDNAIRQQMDRVLQTTPNLTAEEREALETIVMGSKGQNALRQLGKFSPSGNGLSQWFNLGAVATAGPAGGALPVAGFAAKAAADNITRKRVQGLIELIARGDQSELQQAQQALQNATGPAADALRRAIAARLSRGAGIATSAQQRPSVEVYLESDPTVRGAAYGPAGR